MRFDTVQTAAVSRFGKIYHLSRYVLYETTEGVLLRIKTPSQITVIRNLWVKKNLFSQPVYTPRGAPVNYVQPPTIDVDMFTDLVYQHTHTYTPALISSVSSDRLWSDPSVSLWFWMYPSEHKTPSRAHWPWDELLSPGPCRARKHFSHIYNTATNHWLKLCCQFVGMICYFIDKEPHSWELTFVNDALRLGVFYFIL